MGGLSSSRLVGKCDETAIMGTCSMDGRVWGAAGCWGENCEGKGNGGVVGAHLDVEQGNIGCDVYGGCGQ